ncbi:ABC transporter [Neisseria gonorrhoeae]|nr:ATP-binding cassette transporter [Neisseria gonorrhoeae DGI2]MBG9969472.1 ABC transporter [Neisseria gonorrhoeae]MBG9973684.1 ABC transporter [Neisseria gonorrhoeae]OIA77006.1 ABC transporter [Neisseria gonorrhoeae]ROU34829.1 ABC transporter [Neisseria gonorrhoeae]
MKPVKLKMPSESLSDGILFGLENTYAVLSPKERIQKTKVTGIHRK